MRRLNLHIGLPKTGSTYIQEWLGLNHHQLLRQGFYAVPSLRAHRIGVEAITEESRIDRPDVLSIKRAEWLSIAAADAHQHMDVTAIVSSEYLSESDPTILASVLRRLGFEVIGILGYLRRQDKICASGYAQEVKALGRALPPEETACYSELIDWGLLHQRWQLAFPNTEFQLKNFDKLRSDIVGSFASAIGIDLSDMRQVALPANLSLSARMTEIARLLNVRRISFDVEQLRELDIENPFVPYSFSPKTTAQFEEAFRPSNERFSERFGDEFEDFSLPGWVPIGEDLAGRVKDDEVVNVITALSLGVADQVSKGGNL